MSYYKNAEKIKEIKISVTAIYYSIILKKTAIDGPFFTPKWGYFSEKQNGMIDRMG